MFIVSMHVCVSVSFCLPLLLPAFVCAFRSNDGVHKQQMLVSLQLMLSKFENDGKLNPSFKTGPFKLPVAKIWGFPKEPQAPRFVLVSSAGVTRPDRWVRYVHKRSLDVLQRCQELTYLQLIHTAYKTVNTCMLLYCLC